MGKLIITLLLSLISIGVCAQAKWELKKDEDGIKVFTSVCDNSCFKAIKVECTLTATQSQLVAFLLDVEKQPEWIYNNKSTRFIKKYKDNDQVFYSEVNVPWPCSNRDYISHFLINQVSPTQMSIDSHAEPDFLPQKKGLVRVKSSVAHWEVTTLSNSLLKVIYTVQFDPGGSVPAWLTNMFVTKGPFHTFEKLRAGVKNTAYQGAHFDFIKE